MRSTIFEELKSVKSITLLFGGWMDKYHKISFIRTQIVTVNIEQDMKIFTLRCFPLIGHTAKNIKNHIDGVTVEIFPHRIESLKLYPVHDEFYLKMVL